MMLKEEEEEVLKTSFLSASPLATLAPACNSPSSLLLGGSCGTVAQVYLGVCSADISILLSLFSLTS